MDILFFAIIAVFIIFRLLSVMGTRDDEMTHRLKQRKERVEQAYPIPGREQAATMKEVNTPPAEPLIISKDIDPSVVLTMQAVQKRQPDFNEKFFLEGAQNAFDMVLKAFTACDKLALKMLVEEPVYKELSQAIDEREKTGEFAETTLVGIRKAELVKGNLYRNIASLSVKFISEQITLMRDRGKKIISGDPSAVRVVEDVWTFHRQLDTDGMDWKLAATSRVQ